MKKRITALILVMVICLSLCGVAYARGALSVTCAVTKSKSACTVETMNSENLYVSFSVYKVEGNSESFMTSASASKAGTSVTASSTKTLSSGTYKIYIYASGNTVTSNSEKTFVI